MKWNIGWGTISKCNMNCNFCYSKTQRQSTIDLTYADWIRFVNENYRYIQSINYGTGENALSSEWFRLVEYIRDYYPRIKQAVTTNGYLSEAVRDQSNMLAFLKGIDEVDISLDFADPLKHNEFRGQPMAYNWAIDTFKLCRQMNKKTTLVFLGSKVTVSHENIDGLFAIANQYGAVLRMNMFRPTDGINQFSKRFIINREQLMDTLSYINEKYNILSIGDAYLSPVLTGCARPDPSGSASIRILANGNITPSTYLIQDDFVIGSIKQTNVLEMLESEMAIKQIMHPVLPLECEGCVYAKSCVGGVLDRRYLWYGTLSKKDPYCNRLYTEVIQPLIKIKGNDFSSIHDDYLPTIFFKP